MRDYDSHSYAIDENELKDVNERDPYGLNEPEGDDEAGKNGKNAFFRRVCRWFYPSRTKIIYGTLALVFLGGGVCLWNASGRSVSGVCGTVSSLLGLGKTADLRSVKPGGFPGDKRTLEVDGIAYIFRWCPRGKFRMGSSETEKGRKDDEAQHLVSFPAGFWILETEITQEMWASVMGKEPASDEEKRFPTADVSWKEAQRFCEKLSKKAQFHVQLPTEAQWEYACRAGVERPFVGDPNRVAWFSGNSGGKLHPVKRRKGNNWSVYDMHGNAPEWCRDLYDVDFYAKSPDEAPTGPTFGRFHVVRGGSFDSKQELCRAAARDSQKHYSSAGFRIVIEYTGKKK